MVTYAYLRVSTNQQDVNNQRQGIFEYANQKGLGHLQFVEDTVSGQKRWRERELISMRTKEALAKRREAGKSLGRPKGRQSAKLKLDTKKQEIMMYLDKGISKRSIAKLVDCAPSTLYYWMKRHKLSKSNSHQ